MGLALSLSLHLEALPLGWQGGAMLELHLNVWIYNPIVRTYIQGDMHDGGEGGLYPPLPL